MSIQDSMLETIEKTNKELFEKIDKSIIDSLEQNNHTIDFSIPSDKAKFLIEVVRTRYYGVLKNIYSDYEYDSTTGCQYLCRAEIIPPLPPTTVKEFWKSKHESRATT